MNSLSFKVVVMVLILAAAFVGTQSFIVDSIADVYVVIADITPIECVDTSVSIDVICYSALEVLISTVPYHNLDDPDAPHKHPAQGLVIREHDTRTMETDGCYIGCTTS